MYRFVNRVHELADLRDFVTSQRSELVIIYGRRGAGKSALVAETMSGQPHVFYQATTRMLPQQLEDLKDALRAFAPDVVLPGVLASVDAFLAAVAQIARTRPDSPTVLVNGKAKSTAGAVVELKWKTLYLRRCDGSRWKVIRLCGILAVFLNPIFNEVPDAFQFRHRHSRPYA